MDETESTVINAAISTFVRYGARKTSMSDIADAAGVSRQTLYDIFGNKDELVVATIRHITSQNLHDVRDGIKGKKGIKSKLNVYFEKVTIRSFLMVQEARDPEVAVSGGRTEAGKATIEESKLRHQALLVELLAPYEASIEENGHTVTDVAKFIVFNAMSLKYSQPDEAALRKIVSTTIAAAMGLIGEK